MSESSVGGPRPQARVVRPLWLVLAALVIAEVVSAFESAMVFIAFPKMMEDFQSDAATVSWVGTAYLLVAAVAGSLGGRFGDMYGRRKVLIIVLAISAVGSLVSLFAPSLLGVIAGRAIQGAAGAILPLCIALSREALGEKKSPVGVSIVSATALLAGSAGGLVAGLLIDFTTWRYLFAISAALAVVAIFVVLTVISQSPHGVKGQRVDFLGAGLLVISIGALLGGVTFASGWGWDDPMIIALIGGGLIAVTVFIAVELKIENPLISVRLLANRQMGLTLAATALLFVGPQGAMQVLKPMILQLPTELPVGLGQAATLTGAMGMLSSGIAFLLSPVFGNLLIRFGTRTILLWGIATTGAGFATLYWVQHDLVLFLVMTTVIIGIGSSIVFVSLPNAAIGAVPASAAGEAAGIFTTFRLTFLGSSTAIIGSVLSTNVIPGTTLPAEGAFNTGYTMILVLTAAAFVVVAFMPRMQTPRQESKSASALGGASDLAGRK